MTYSDLLASPQAQLLKLEKARQKSALRRWFNSRPLHEAQYRIYKNRARFRVVACGRRFGKTELGRREAVEVATHGGYVWWISPTYPMSQDVWAQLNIETKDIRTGLNKSEREIRFEGGGKLRVLSGDDPDKLRGAGLDYLVIDEAAFCGEGVWQVLRPALADKQGRALFLSTPQGHNWFWRVYQAGLDPLKPEWASWRMPSMNNPFLPPSEIEAARRDMPERMFKQEIEAEFLEDGGAVFRNIDQCIKTPPEKSQVKSVVIGVDFARSQDFTVLTALDEASKCVLEIDRFNEVNWSVQRGRIQAMVQRWPTRLVVAESNSIGEPNIELLQNEGMKIQGFQTTASTKQPLIDALALAIENQQIGLVDNPVLINELQSYEMERTPSGNWRYSAPDGGHDDCVISLALAWYATNSRRSYAIEGTKYA